MNKCLFSVTDRKILEVLEEVKTEVKLNSRQINSIIKMLDKSNDKSLSKMPNDVVIPVRTDLDLTKLEDALKDDTKRQQMVKNHNILLVSIYLYGQF